MKPLVSILIPCHNAAPWIAETLESAIAQTWLNKEIIVVDDGSTDASLEIATSFQSSQVKIISQANQGAASARNLAYRQAQGDYIQYLDADDLLAPDKIEQQILMLDSDRGSISSAAWGRFTTQPEKATFCADPLWQTLSPIDWVVIALVQNTMMNPACWLLPREIAQTAGNWDETLTLNDDGEYFWRMILASQQVRFCPKATVYYRSSITGSLSSQTTPLAWQSLYRSLESVEHHLLSIETSDRTRHALATAFQRFIYQTYPAVPMLRKTATQKVSQLGGADLLPMGGQTFQKCSRLIGWKLAKRLQQFTTRFAFS